jgi:hypothetical protein
MIVTETEKHLTPADKKTSKVCKLCGQEKDIDNFALLTTNYKRDDSGNVIYAYVYREGKCSACRSVYAKKRYQRLKRKRGMFTGHKEKGHRDYQRGDNGFWFKSEIYHWH